MIHACPQCPKEFQVLGQLIGHMIATHGGTTPEATDTYEVTAFQIANAVYHAQWYQRPVPRMPVIKAVRRLTGMGLLEAKRVVDTVVALDESCQGWGDRPLTSPVEAADEGDWDPTDNVRHLPGGS